MAAFVVSQNLVLAVTTEFLQIVGNFLHFAVAESPESMLTLMKFRIFWLPPISEAEPVALKIAQ